MGWTETMYYNKLSHFDDAIEKADEKWYHAKFGDNDGFKVVDGESFYAETDDGMTQKWFY